MANERIMCLMSGMLFSSTCLNACRLLTANALSLSRARSLSLSLSLSHTHRQMSTTGMFESAVASSTASGRLATILKSIFGVVTSCSKYTIYRALTFEKFWQGSFMSSTEHALTQVLIRGVCVCGWGWGGWLSVRLRMWRTRACLP